MPYLEDAEKKRNASESEQRSSNGKDRLLWISTIGEKIFLTI